MKRTKSQILVTYYTKFNANTKSYAFKKRTEATTLKKKYSRSEEVPSLKLISELPEKHSDVTERKIKSAF